MGETSKGAPEGPVVPVDLADKAYDVADAFSHLYGCDEEIRTKMTDAIGMALAQERESCAFTAETHSGFGDPASIEAIAAMIRERGDTSPPWVDCIHVSPERYRELLAIETPPVDFTIDPFETYYRNWRGDVELRWIIPTRVWRGSTSWHPEPQWILRAFDVNRQAERDFALKDFLPESAANAALSPVAVEEADAEAGGLRALQTRVGSWTLECFGDEIACDLLERMDRFTEEALELVQSLGYTPDRAHALVDYVFGREAGEPSQEVGGSMTTLAALCNVASIDIEAAFRTEVERITTPAMVEKIRAKQAIKPTGSALPTAAAAPSTPSPQIGEVQRLVEETGSSSVDDLRDMALVGHSLMEVMGIATADGPYKDWAPAENPTEIVIDLINDLEEAITRAERAEQFQRANGTARQTAETALAETRERLEKVETSLRNIAEGNLGNEPWQANYERIRVAARAALSTQESSAALGGDGKEAGR